MRTIAENSPRLAAARRFGDALQAAMARSQVGQGVLAAAAGVGRSSVVQWRMGRNLPTLEAARRLSEAGPQKRPGGCARWSLEVRPTWAAAMSASL